MWIDLIALEKVRFGLLAYFYDISSLTFSKDTRFHFEKIDPIEARFKKPFDSNVINTVVQGAILSEMKGTLSKMSTERFTMRWVVQPMNSEKVFPLISSVWKGERRADGHAYYIAPDRNLLKKDTEGDLCILKEKDFSKSYEAITTNDRNTLLKINSSRANLQFLDKSFSGFWKEQEPKLSSYSFIVEETYNVSWSDKDGVSFVPSKDNPQRLFVSIPFELGFSESEKQNELLTRRNKLLGVDIGEYGIAIYLLDADSMGEKVLTSFIFEPSLRRIREGIREGKESQRAGTFSIPSTRVQRLRDNAITILRNRIHAIVVSHNARPVYEKEVSAFESGSGKISKIYHSVKRSDVFQENPADKLEADLVWGKYSKLIGREVSAYATSYSCSHCHESVYAYITKGEYEMEYKVIDVISAWKDKKGRPQSIFVIDVEGVHVKGFLKKSCTAGDYLNGKEAQKAIRDYARPPLPIFFERHDGERVFKKLGINKEEFKKRRGNQAIWVCPFCDAISDADVQAALWIALKGWLNLHISSNLDEQQYFKDMTIQGGWADKSIKEKMRFLLQFAKEKKIPPVQLEDC